MQGALTNEPNAVEIEVTFRNFDSTPQTKEYALKRLGKVIRSLRNLTGAAVEIRFDRNAPEDSGVVVQATLAAKGTLLRTEDSGINATAAIDSGPRHLVAPYQRLEGAKARFEKKERG
jgi:ribosome-associated translation inhibitor RaiA